MKILEKIRYDLALKEYYNRTRKHVPSEHLINLDPWINVIQTYEERHSAKTANALFRNFILNLLAQFIGTTVVSYWAIYVLLIVFKVPVEVSLGNSLLVASVIYAYRTKFTFNV